MAPLAFFDGIGEKRGVVRMVIRWLALVGGSLLSIACVTSEVTYTGKAKYPPKPKNCAVEVFPSTEPPYEREDLATVEATCNAMVVGRTGCIDALKKRVCELGGDTLYDFKDGKLEGANVVIATVALRQGASSASGESAGDSKPESTPAPAAQAVAVPGCDPPCSPGYTCTNAQCVAVCNPPCGPGMQCNQQRSCEASPVVEAPPESAPTAAP